MKTKSKVSSNQVDNSKQESEFTEVNSDDVKLAGNQIIWNQIKDLKLNVFGFEESVEKYFSLFPLLGNDCYLTCKVSAAFPALESILPSTFTVDKSDKYYIIKRS